MILNAISLRPGPLPSALQATPCLLGGHSSIRQPSTSCLTSCASWAERENQRRWSRTTPADEWSHQDSPVAECTPMMMIQPLLLISWCENINKSPKLDVALSDDQAQLWSFSDQNFQRQSCWCIWLEVHCNIWSKLMIFKYFTITAVHQLYWRISNSDMFSPNRLHRFECVKYHCKCLNLREFIYTQSRTGHLAARRTGHPHWTPSKTHLTAIAWLGCIIFISSEQTTK